MIVSLVEMPEDFAPPGRVVFPAPDEQEKIYRLLKFVAPPTQWQIKRRAFYLAAIAAEIAEREKCRTALVEGPEFLCGPLERAIAAVGLTPYYCYVAPDGDVSFIPAALD